jgi:hypothetical protein
MRRTMHRPRQGSRRTVRDPCRGRIQPSHVYRWSLASARTTVYRTSRLRRLTCRVSGTGASSAIGDSSAADAAQNNATLYQGCSQKALAPLAILLCRYRGACTQQPSNRATPRPRDPTRQSPEIMPPNTSPANPPRPLDSSVWPLPAAAAIRRLARRLKGSVCRTTWPGPVSVA